MNFAAGQTVANLVTVKVGGDGNVMLYNAAGSTHVIFDVVGWYGGSGTPLPPAYAGPHSGHAHEPAGQPRRENGGEC